ncbi:MAG: hypothetical protein [Inoviridae sp.]|nr:MAG: hypothetical protein [Inoviridae sp.]
MHIYQLLVEPTVQIIKAWLRWSILRIRKLITLKETVSKIMHLTRNKTKKMKNKNSLHKLLKDMKIIRILNSLTVPFRNRKQ